MADSKDKPGKMVRYISTQPTTAGGGYAPPGTPFVTDAPKLPEWTEIDADAKAVIEAADPLQHSQFNIDGADRDSLKARAAALNLNFAGNITTDALRDLVRAANEPAL